MGALVFPWRKRHTSPERQVPGLAAAERAVRHSSRQLEAAHLIAEVVDKIAERFERIRAEDHFGERIQQAMHDQESPRAHGS